MARQVWGIDIGRFALKAVRLNPLRDGVEITGVEYIPYDDYEEVDSSQIGRTRGTWQALAEFQRRRRVRNEKVVISVPGAETFIRSLSLVLVGRKSIHEIVQYEAHQQIPFVLDEVIWDYEVFEPADPESREREGMIFAVKKNLLNNYFLSLSSANLPVDDVQPTPVALYNFFKYDQDIGEATLAINVGSDGACLLAMTPDEFWTRSIPVGGRKATTVLAEEFGLDLERAEAAKQNLAKSKHAKELLEVILPAIMELVGEVQKSLAYQRTQGKDYPFERAVLVGGGANLMGLRTMLERSLGMEVTRLEQLGVIDIAEDADVNLLAEDLGRYAVAMGLALHGCGHTACDVSLIPQRTARKSMLGRAKPYLAAAPALLLATLLTAYGFAKQRNAALKKLYAGVVQTQVEAMGELQERLKKAQDVSELVKNLRAIRKIGEGRGVWLDLFDELMTNVLPDNTKAGLKEEQKIWLIDLDLHTPQPGEKLVKDQDGRDRLKGSLTAGFRMARGESENKAYFRAQDIVVARLREDARFVTSSIKFVTGWPRAQLHEKASPPKPGTRGYYVFKIEFEFYKTPSPPALETP